GRSDFHRLFRDVDVRQLPELVIHTWQLFLDVLRGIRKLFLDPRDVEINAAVRTAAALLDFADDASGHVIAGEQLGGTPRVLIALGVPPAFLLVIGSLGAVVRRDVVKHEPAALAVPQHSTFAAHALGDKNPGHAWWIDHARGMELDVFHFR